MKRPKVHQRGFSSGFWPWTVYGVLFVPTIGFIVAAFAEARFSGSVGWALVGGTLAVAIVGLHLVAIRWKVPHVHDYHSVGPRQHQCHKCQLAQPHTNTGWRYPIWSPVGYPSALAVSDGWTSCTRCHVPYPCDALGNPATESPRCYHRG